jgi:hypothetical protein
MRHLLRSRGTSHGEAFKRQAAAPQRVVAKASTVAHCGTRVLVIYIPTVLGSVLGCFSSAFKYLTGVLESTK